MSSCMYVHLIQIVRFTLTRNQLLLREQLVYYLLLPRARSRGNEPIHLALESFLSNSPLHLFQTILNNLKQPLLIKRNSPILLRKKILITTIIRLTIRLKSVQKYLNTTSIRSINYTYRLQKLILIIRKLVRLYSQKIVMSKRRLLLRQDS